MMIHWLALGSWSGSMLWMYLTVCWLLWDLGEGGSHPRVVTPVGTIHGTYVEFNNTTVSAFLGVPFAQPPVWKLRFKHPQPVQGNRRRNIYAQTLPAACIQSVRPQPSRPWNDYLPGKSEDCLYLNIWSPQLRRFDLRKKAVMLWIYGGSFSAGSNRLDVYDGRVLAALGDVIVVAPNYRMGPQGFLYTGTKDIAGNMGMYDLVEALSWVRANIGWFGGDAERVTVFGQSAGSASIGLLMTSPAAQGLFQRAILESGSAVNLIPDFNAYDKGVSLAGASALGCAQDGSTPEEIDACLMDADGLELSRAVAGVTSPSQLALFPRYVSELLPVNPLEAYKTGNVSDVDVLIGVTSDEGAILPIAQVVGIFGPTGEENPPINKTVGQQLLGSFFAVFPFGDEIVEHYLGGLDEDDYDNVKKQVYTAIGDFRIVCPSVYAADSLSKQGKRVSFYMFDHRPSTSTLPPLVEGAVHFDEVPFVFGIPLRYPSRYSAPEVALSRRMVRMWTRFAKTGITKESWPMYSTENPTYLTLDTKKSARGYGPRQEDCDFLRTYFGI